MKTKELNPHENLELTTYLPTQTAPFVITGSYETIMPIAEQLEAETSRPSKQVAQKVTAPVITAPKPKEQYIDLAGLNDREIARMSLTALKYDIVTFGRNREYRRFKERVAQERDLAMDMELGLIQSIHCRLHEKALAKLN